jgi:hypothetical protein
MNVVIADESLQHFLANLTQKVEVHDVDGNILGFFSPKQWEDELLYSQAENVCDPVEIHRRLRDEKTGFTFEEVKQHLKSLENS